MLSNAVLKLTPKHLDVLGVLNLVLCRLGILVDYISTWQTSRGTYVSCCRRGIGGPSCYRPRPRPVEGFHLMLPRYLMPRLSLMKC